MDRINLIIDCDTGLDDMVALMYAANRNEFNLLGVVAVAGNQTVDKTLKNTLNVMQVLNDTVPVYKGCDKPLLRDQVTAGEFHGESGLQGPVFPPLKKTAEELSGVDFILETIKTKKVTIVAIGPLTDIAKVVKQGSEYLHNIESVIVMGSSFIGGNVTPYAEFNTYADPEAASIVYSSPLKVVLFSLDVTHQVEVQKNAVSFGKSLNNLVGDMFSRGIKSYQEAYTRNNGGVALIHDPCCIAYLLHPNLFEGENCSVIVNLNKDDKEYGKTTKIAEKGNILAMNKLTSLELFWKYFNENLLEY